MTAAWRFVIVGSRTLPLWFVAALTLAACGADAPTAIDLGATAPATTAPAEAQASTAEPTTSGPAMTDTTTADTSVTTQPAAPVRQRPEGPDAVGFDLALGGPGGTFSLAEETRPVFLVFWAEW